MQNHDTTTDPSPLGYDRRTLLKGAGAAVLSAFGLGAAGPILGASPAPRVPLPHLPDTDCFRPDYPARPLSHVLGELIYRTFAHRERTGAFPETEDLVDYPRELGEELQECFGLLRGAATRWARWEREQMDLSDGLTRYGPATAAHVRCLLGLFQEDNPLLTGNGCAFVSKGTRSGDDWWTLVASPPARGDLRSIVDRIAHVWLCRPEYVGTPPRFLPGPAQEDMRAAYDTAEAQVLPRLVRAFTDAFFVGVPVGEGAR